MFLSSCNCVYNVNKGTIIYFIIGKYEVYGEFDNFIIENLFTHHNNIFYSIFHITFLGQIPFFQNTLLCYIDTKFKHIIFFTDIKIPQKCGTAFHNHIFICNIFMYHGIVVDFCRIFGPNYVNFIPIIPTVNILI